MLLMQQRRGRRGLTGVAGSVKVKFPHAAGGGAHGGVLGPCTVCGPHSMPPT